MVGSWQEATVPSNSRQSLEGFIGWGLDAEPEGNKSYVEHHVSLKMPFPLSHCSCLLDPDGKASCKCAAGFQGNGTVCTGKCSGDLLGACVG